MPMFGKRVPYVPKHMRSIEEDQDTDISHHGIKGMKWGVRRYQNPDGSYTSEGKLRRQVLAESNTVQKSLTTKAQPFVAEPIDISKVQTRGSLSQSEAEECARLATDIFKTAQKHEPKITNDIIDAVSKSNAKMYGLDHRMKQPTSLAAKIGSDAKSDGVSFEQASNDIHDTIRYTAVSDPSNFSQTYNSVKKQLEANGYSEIQCKNYFKRFSDGKVSHKAIQSVYSTPDGVSFELQFQTPESQAVKELKIPLYEEARQLNTTPERKTQLSKNMRMLGDNITDPDGVFDILEHDEIYSDSVFGTRVYLAHHGIKGQHWGVRNGPPYPLKPPRTDISDKTYARINELYRSMPLADRRMIDPDISDESQDYFKNSKYYHDNTAFNAVSDNGFVIAEKIPADKNIDGTHGVEIGIGVTEKGRGVGTGLTKDLVDWFDNQDEYDAMWWPVDENNKGSIRIAEKNGFIKDPLGNNYIYATGQAYRDLGIKDDLPDNIYNNLDTFDYGCVINGKRYNETNLDEVDWSQYRTIPTDIFENTKIGTCWDYTNYQHSKLKEAGINHDTHLLVMDTKDGPVTHTFTTYEDPVNHKQYWLEQALYSERGIHPINSYTDAVDVISRKYDPSGKRAFDVYEFNPDGMDQGLNDQEFFNKATSNDPVLQRK